MEEQDYTELAELLRRLQREHDYAVFDEIVKRTQHYVIRKAKENVDDWHEAEEVAQEVYKKFFHEYARIVKPRALMKWFFYAVKDKCRPRRRYIKRHVVVPNLADTIDSSEDHATSPRDALMSKEDSLEIAAALEEAERDLPDRFRHCFELRYIENKTPDEIARALDMGVETVYTYCSRALTLVRNHKALQKWQKKTV